MGITQKRGTTGRGQPRSCLRSDLVNPKTVQMTNQEAKTMKRDQYKDAVRRRLQRAIDDTNRILAEREKSQPTGQHALF
ncbi:MAG: hypothetical protein BMS9Abin33_1250 [Gammaproteobacteria bacterium]|nr:MAG: hypothetical protein BMS9Abin33_1250 [Gammaproteobacteria bacterium]